MLSLTEIPKLDVASAFEEAVEVEGKQLEDWGGLDFRRFRVLDLNLGFRDNGKENGNCRLVLFFFFFPGLGLRDSKKGDNGKEHGNYFLGLKVYRLQSPSSR